MIINLNHELRQFFGLPYMDKTDDETDDEQPGTTDMPDLESEEETKKEKDLNINSRSNV